MKTIIAGPRDCTLRWEVMEEAVKASGFEISEVISGGADGVDRMGEMWAELRRLPVRRFPPDWKTYGRKAGPLRNRAMVEVADALIVVKYAARQTPGTADVLRRAKKKGIKVHVKEV